MVRNIESKALKPIETVWNNMRFRSRLEAKWASYFDLCGEQYEYEPEGFVLGDDTWYLPDFYLPDKNIYIEIKPLGALKVDDTPVIKNGRENADKYNSAIKTLTEAGKQFVLLQGTPYESDTKDDGYRVIWYRQNEIAWCDGMHEIVWDESIASIVNKFRFDGHDLEYAIKQARNEHPYSLRCQFLEESVLGMLRLHPEYSALAINDCSDTIEDIKFGYGWANSLAWILKGRTEFMLNYPDHSSVTDGYNSYFKPQFKVNITGLAIILLEHFANDRKGLPCNDKETFLAYAKQLYIEQQSPKSDKR